MSIEDYKLSDSMCGVSITVNSNETIRLDNVSVPWFYLDKQDATAIAKHFELIQNCDSDNCPNWPSKCKVVDVGTEPNVNLPNSFNIKIDGSDATKAHVLQVDNQDRESLVSSIKELIGKVDSASKTGGVSDGYYCAKDGLQKLIEGE